MVEFYHHKKSSSTQGWICPRKLVLQTSIAGQLLIRDKHLLHISLNNEKGSGLQDYMKVLIAILLKSWHKPCFYVPKLLVFIPSVSVGSPKKVLDLNRCTSSKGGSFTNSNVIVPISSKELTVILHSSFSSLCNKISIIPTGTISRDFCTSWLLLQWFHLIVPSRQIRSTNQSQILSFSFLTRFFQVQ